MTSLVLNNWAQKFISAASFILILIYFLLLLFLFFISTPDISNYLYLKIHFMGIDFLGISSLR